MPEDLGSAEEKQLKTNNGCTSLGKTSAFIRLHWLSTKSQSDIKLRIASLENENKYLDKDCKSAKGSLLAMRK